MEKINKENLTFERVRLDDTLFKIFYSDKEIKRFLTNYKNELIQKVKYEGITIGFINVCFSSGIPEIQGAILERYRNRGFASLMLNVKTNELFEQGYPRTMLKINPKNAPSIKVAEACDYHIDYDTQEFNPNNQEKDYIFYRNNPNLRNKL